MARLRKIKRKTRKISEKKIGGEKKGTRVTRVPSTAKIKKEILGLEELAIERAKFSHPQVSPLRKTAPTDLPYQYDQDKIVLQVRDPRWIHAYWGVKGLTLARLKDELGQEFYQAKMMLRVYDVSQLIFNGTNAHRFFDIELNQDANNWYIDTAGPGRSWCVDLGLLLPQGKFITIVRSNTVDTPLEGPSWITDEEWMIPDDMFARLYGMGFGLGRSSPVGKAWQERVRQGLFSGMGITSVASPVKKLPQKKKLWLVVNTELLVYGATLPDAKVTLQGKPLKLRQDGTFTLRFALTDGKQVIPVKAVSCDDSEERTITPIVTRETK